jgi:hypothetical protein
MLRRVPPYEACGGAMGFSPSELHFKRIGRERPIDVKSIEEVLRAKEKKKEERRKRKQLKRDSEQSDQKANSYIKNDLTKQTG